MKKYLTFAAATLLLAACSSDETLYHDDDRVALQVTSGIQTRAVDDMWEYDDAIGIFMLAGNGMPDTYANIQYTTQDNDRYGLFAPANETIYLPTDDSSRDFIAYYPWTDALTNNVYPIDLSNQAAQEKIDFMIAKVSGINRRNSTANFQFAHKLSKIVMTIEPGADITKDDLEGLEIRLTNQRTSGTYDLLNGSAAVPGQTTGYIALKVAANGTSAEAIVFPSTDYTDMVFKFHTQGVGDYECSVPSFNAQSFEAGKKYKYTIIINNIGLDVSAEILDWMPGNGYGGETGYAE